MPSSSDAVGTLARSAWQLVLDALPPLQGLDVVDVGCGERVQAAELAVRGARVLGLDMNPDSLREARRREIVGAEFRDVDLRLPLDRDRDVDGLWCSYVAEMLVTWRELLECLARPDHHSPARAHACLAIRSMPTPGR